MADEIDIPLKKDEEKEKIDFLKSHKFEDFKIHSYYTKTNYLKHGVELEDVKSVFPQFEKIVGVFKRRGNSGYKYSFIYNLGEVKSMYLCFFLDENPPQFFNAYYNYTKVHKTIKAKIQKWMVKDYIKDRQSLGKKR